MNSFWGINFDILNEMDKIVKKRHNLRKLTQDEIENRISRNLLKSLNSLVKLFSQSISQAWVALIVNYSKYLQIFYKEFQGMEKLGTVPKSL